MQGAPTATANYEPKRQPERDLAVAIMDEARDCALGTIPDAARKTARKRVVLEARDWFLNLENTQYGSLVWCCDLLELEAATVSRQVAAQWGGAVPEPIATLVNDEYLKPCPGLPDRACAPKPGFHHARALEELIACRDELQAQIEKIEAAIETLEAMA